MTAAIIITAGRTSGDTSFKPLKQEGGISVLMRLILTFQQAGVENVIVVSGSNATEVEKEAAHMNAIFLRMDGEYEMLDGIKRALTFSGSKYRQVIITHTNAPLFLVDTVQQLLDAGAQLAMPYHAGKPGHPVLIAQELYADVLAYEGEGGLQGFINGFGGGIHPVNVEDEGIHAYVGNAGTASIAKQHSLRRLRPDIRLSIARERVSFGPGTYLLLQLVEDTGSVRDGSRLMGISYSKAWKILESAEQMLGFPLIERQQGGAKGGKSELTGKGRELVQRYREFTAESRKAVEKIFAEKFEGMD